MVQVLLEVARLLEQVIDFILVDYNAKYEKLLLTAICLFPFLKIAQMHIPTCKDLH